MGTDKMKMIEGVPSAETTAVTMRSIHELLEEEAAARAAARAAGAETPAPTIAGAVLQTPPRGGAFEPLADPRDSQSDQPRSRFFKKLFRR